MICELHLLFQPLVPIIQKFNGYNNKIHYAVVPVKSFKNKTAKADTSVRQQRPRGDARGKLAKRYAHCRGPKIAVERYSLIVASFALLYMTVI